jgi:hypothetical protein
MPGSPWRWRMTSFITIDKGVLIVLVLLIHTRDDVYPQLTRLLGR